MNPLRLSNLEKAAERSSKSLEEYTRELKEGAFIKAQCFDRFTDRGLDEIINCVHLVKAVENIEKQIVNNINY